MHALPSMNRRILALQQLSSLPRPRQALCEPGHTIAGGCRMVSVLRPRQRQRAFATSGGCTCFHSGRANGVAIVLARHAASSGLK